MTQHDLERRAELIASVARTELVKAITKFAIIELAKQVASEGIAKDGTAVLEEAGK
jgi:hypothetical protein